MWCNQYQAYDRLSPTMKRMLEGLRVKFVGLRLGRMMGADAASLPTAVHPLVRTHPETGRKALYVGHRETAQQIEGMTDEESRPLLDFLYEHSTNPDNIYRHMWQEGDVVMWDNRCTMHYAVHDYGEAGARAQPHHDGRRSAAMKRDDRALAQDVEPVREAFRFDEQRLARWLHANVDGQAGAPRVSQFKGGQSNPTYRVDTDRGSYVLRRKPPGDLLKGAHAIDREYRGAGGPARSGVSRCRAVHGLVPDDEVIGTEFYVMDMRRRAHLLESAPARGGRAPSAQPISTR